MLQDKLPAWLAFGLLVAAFVAVIYGGREAIITVIAIVVVAPALSAVNWERYSLPNGRPGDMNSIRPYPASFDEARRKNETALHQDMGLVPWLEDEMYHRKQKPKPKPDVVIIETPSEDILQREDGDKFVIVDAP